VDYNHYCDDILAMIVDEGRGEIPSIVLSNRLF
jgi:hypothetical protein